MRTRESGTRGVLQCVAVCCSVLQCVAVCCSVLQCVAVCCSVLQCVVREGEVERRWRNVCIAAYCCVLRCTALYSFAGLQCARERAVPEVCCRGFGVAVGYSVAVIRKEERGGKEMGHQFVRPKNEEERERNQRCVAVCVSFCYSVCVCVCVYVCVYSVLQRRQTTEEAESTRCDVA